MYAMLQGELWKFTKRQWELYCHCSAVKGSAHDPADVGAKSLSTNVKTVTDWERQDFLNELPKRKA